MVTIKKLRIEFENHTDDNLSVTQMLETLIQEINEGAYDLEGEGEDWSPIEQYEKGTGEIWFSTVNECDDVETDEAGGTDEPDE